MTVTHVDNTLRTEPINEEIFVPRYAQTGRRKKGGVRTWMILAPIGALVAIGGGAVMMMGAPESEPLVAERASPLVQPAAPLESSTAPAALTTGDLPANVTITETAPAPVVREAPPAPPPAVQRRQPAERRAAPVETAPAEAVATPPLAGPQPYIAPSMTAAPSEAAGRAPAIIPAPLS